MVRTVQTLLHSQLACNEMQASARTRRRQHDRKCRLKSSQVKSIYFNHPSQGNSTNYYPILGLRDKAAPSTSQQINKLPPKRVKNLATPSSIFIFVFSSFTGELCSQPIRGNDRPIGRMFPDHVERRFLDPEYSFDEYFQLGSRRKVGPIKNVAVYSPPGCTATLWCTVHPVVLQRCDVQSTRLYCNVADCTPCGPVECTIAILTGPSASKVAYSRLTIAVTYSI